MSKAARSIREDRLNSFYLEMTDIMPAATGVTEYHDKLKEVYWNRLKDKDVKPVQSGYDLGNKEQGMIVAHFLLRGLKGMR